MKEFAESFYKSKRWQKTRDAYYKLRLGICERCGGSGRIVHHKIYLTPANINDPNVSLNFKYLELLCRSCHRSEHRGEHSERYRIDESGDILPPGV